MPAEKSQLHVIRISSPNASKLCTSFACAVRMIKTPESSRSERIVFRLGWVCLPFVKMPKLSVGCRFPGMRPFSKCLHLKNKSKSKQLSNIHDHVVIRKWHQSDCTLQTVDCTYIGLIDSLSNECMNHQSLKQTRLMFGWLHNFLGQIILTCNRLKRISVPSHSSLCY